MKFTLTSILFIFSHFLFGQLQSSNLPIVLINTNGKFIVDEPKVMVEFKIIFNGEGKLNTITDLPTHYNGFAGIEFRGSSSQMFPKKPYGIELWNKDGEENPQPLLGMPKETDWILFASYNEKSLMHNVFTMSLGRQLNMYASRTRYVELVLNGNYQGVYVFMEKIKRDDNRVAISNLKVEDVSGDQLTGGYILKIDKSTGANIGSFRSKYPNTGQNFSTYFYDSPKTINTSQKKYITDYIGKFEDAVASPDFKDSEKGYRKFIDVPSFIKIFILNEVSRNIDGYRISSYLYKDRDSKGGKLFAGPPWDYDISYGNADYCQGLRYDLFAYRFNEICPGDFWQVPFFWQKIISDNTFVAELRAEYFKQRKTGGVLDYARIEKDINEMALELKDAQIRNFQKWPILGVYVWPNPQPISRTFEGEVAELKNFIYNRLVWLDSNLPKEFVLTGSEIPVGNLSVKAFPNPFVDRITLNIDSNKDIEADVVILNVSGKQLFSEKILLKEGKNEKQIFLENFNNYQAVSILKIKTKDGEMKMTKLVSGN